jgi:hypothetical protein
MRYLLFICGDYTAGPEGVPVMQRETPHWVEEMDGRGVRLLGRQLDPPEAAATVRVRNGQTLVTDGPFAETKEFIAGFDLVECADLDEAIEVAAKHPSSWFGGIEIRPFLEGLRLTERAPAFGRSEDGDASPYLLMTVVGDQAARDAGEAWRRDLEERGLLILGSALKAPETATTVQVRNGQTQLSDGPYIESKEFVAGIAVISCTDRQQAIQLAATHPLVGSCAIEVRPFFNP